MGRYVTVGDGVVGLVVGCEEGTNVGGRDASRRVVGFAEIVGLEVRVGEGVADGAELGGRDIDGIGDGAGELDGKGVGEVDGTASLFLTVNGVTECRFEHAAHAEQNPFGADVGAVVAFGVPGVLSSPSSP